jgi:hypothetical protein
MVRAPPSPCIFELELTPSGGVGAHDCGVMSHLFLHMLATQVQLQEHLFYQSNPLNIFFRNGTP